MKFQVLESGLLAASFLASATGASAVPSQSDIRVFDESLVRRASPQAPNNYAPQPENCPSTRPTIRSAATISPQERDWLQLRRANTLQPMKDLLGRLNINGFDASQYLDNFARNTTAIPNIALAFSGGGYRAMLSGGGALTAFDSRTPGSTQAGHLGGLLQASTYIAGLSGGSWLVGSMYVNNFTSIQSIRDTNPSVSGSLWQLQNSILKGPDQGGIQLLSTAQYFDDLYDKVNSKDTAGFDVSLTDYWGRGLSFQFINATDGGPAFTWSSIADDAEFSQGNAPMPIVVADERFPGETLISINTTVFEFNPFEMGSFDPTVFGFAPLRYLGTNFSSGSVPDNSQCIRGFDNAGFVMGTSSSLFNQIIAEFGGSTSVPELLRGAVSGILSTISSSDNDIADYTPNPFFGWNPATNPSASDGRLTLVDGGLDLQNIPLHPLIQPERAVDVIFAVDSSADVNNWPNATALIATFERSVSEQISNGTAFPAIPDANTIVNQGLNNRPTFFGCDATNTSSFTPLVVYIPNSPYDFLSNKSTLQLDYSIAERNAMLANGYNFATQGNATVDQNWPACVGCAIMQRSWFKTGDQVPPVCQQCFADYCWDGTLSPEPAAPYFPSPRLAQIQVSAGLRATPPSVVVAVVGIGAALLML